MFSGAYASAKNACMAHDPEALPGTVISEIDYILIKERMRKLRRRSEIKRKPLKL